MMALCDKIIKDKSKIKASYPRNLKLYKKI